MMKILFLNPHLQDAPILTTLRRLGVGVVVCSEFRECELVFRMHGASTTLFVGHDSDGVKMGEAIKAHPRFPQVPVILTTSSWTDAQCLQHQATPAGANAYLRLPVDDRDFIHIIDEILGTRLSHGEGFQPSDDLASLDFPAPVDEATKLSIVAAPAFSGIQIEDGASIYGIQSAENGSAPASDLGFVFDAPDMGLESPKIDGADEVPAFDIFAVAPSSTPTEVDPPTSVLANIGHLSDDQPTSVVITPLMAELPSEEAPTRVQVARPAVTEELDSDALSAMPYLGRGAYVNPLSYQEPLGNAVVPGGAMNAPDVETLKKYLSLREQDVSALSTQLRQAKDHIGSLENQLRHEKTISSEFAHLAQDQDRRISGFEKEKSVALEFAQKELEELKFEMKRRNEKVRVMELQVREATDATERLKERVRGDIRKIRTREKELENRLEIMKKDSEALLGARENKIIELKRKLDLIEFNMDIFQDQLEKEKRVNQQLREKLAKAAQIVRVAGGLLSPEEEALLGSTITTEKDRTSAA
ncbi:MAG: hypothetical protein H7301_15165 [Cryobacterium sp.]|nr:hypothetical protein [Oligoflexia bacterium]